MSENSQPTTASGQSWFNLTFGKPWVGFIGTVVTIIAFICGIYFFLAVNKERELVYTINPQRTQIVKADEYSQLKVYFDSTLVTKNLTAVHIVIWNNGELEINSSDVLSPLIIQSADKSEIYDASITDTSRNVIGIHLDTKLKENGKLNISWKILEKRDGFSVQILYAGNEETKFLAESVIKGQGNIKYIQPDVAYGTRARKGIYMIINSFATLGFLLMILFNKRISKSKFLNTQLTKHFSYLDVYFLGFIVITMIAWILYLTDKYSPIIPF